MQKQNNIEYPRLVTDKSGLSHATTFIHGHDVAVRITITIFMLAVIAICPVFAEEKEGIGTLEDNFRNTQQLLEVSSAAKRIEESGNTEAMALREKAKDLYKQAETARDSGDRKKAAQLLSEAKMNMFQGARLAGMGEVGEAKKKEDFKNRAASIRALLEAHKRVLSENRTKNNQELPIETEVEGLLANAEKQYDQGKYTEGKAQLDEAYGKLKVSIEHMRGGETLVNSVDFKTKEEEYDYYLMKVESQLEAITIASNSVAGTPREKSTKDFLEKMTTGRDEAKALAKKGDYDSAVAILEPLFKQAPFRLMSLLK